jgi:hypothetical protein
MQIHFELQMPMKTLELMPNSTVAGDTPERGAHFDHNGQIAGDRVLLYLRCLNFPARQALDLALRALKEAEGSAIQGSEDIPVAEAVQALRRLLREQKKGGSGRDHSMSVGCQVPSPSTSPIHRLHMVPEEVTPARLRSLFTALLGRSRMHGRNGKHVP